MNIQKYLWFRKSLVVVFLLLITGVSADAGLLQREDTQLYKEAYGNVLDENWETALSQLEEFLGQYPNSSWSDDANFWRCYTREKTASSPEEAFQCYETFLRDNPKSKWADDVRTNMIRIGQQLVQQGNVEYKARIAGLKENENEEITLAALSALQNVGDPDALQSIVDLYSRHDSKRIKERVLYILGNSEAPEASEQLINIAREETDPNLQASAIFMFGRQADTTQDVDMLKEFATSSTDRRVKERAVHAIAQAPSEFAGPALRDLVERSEDTEVQKNAIHWYGQIAESAEQMQFLKSVALNNPNTEVRKQAVFGLSRMPAELSEKALLDIAQSETDPEIRENAIFWLGQNAQTPESIGFLRRLATAADDPKIRERAVFALAQLPGRLGQETLIEIAEQEGDSETRKNAIFWLGQNGDEENILDLLKCIAKNDPNEDVRKRAIFALTQVPDKKGIPVILNIVKENPRSDILEDAVFWLGQAAGDEFRDEIRSLLEDIAINNPDPQVQERAIYGLSRMPDNEGIPALINIAQSDVGMTIRKNAIYALGQSNDPRAKAALQSILQGEN